VSYSISTIIRDYYSSEAGVWFLRNGPRPPYHDHNSNTTEEIIKMENYEIFIWRSHLASDQEKESSVILLHGGGWMIVTG
jgi:hypothetical protein